MARRRGRLVLVLLRGVVGVARIERLVVIRPGTASPVAITILAAAPDEIVLRVALQAHVRGPLAAIAPGSLGAIQVDVVPVLAAAVQEVIPRCTLQAHLLGPLATT